MKPFSKNPFSAMFGIPLIGEVLGPGLIPFVAVGLLMCIETVSTSMIQIQQMRDDNQNAKAFNVRENVLHASEHLNGDINAPRINQVGLAPQIAHAPTR